MFNQKEYFKQYYQDHKEKMNEQTKQYCIDNHKECLAIKQKYRDIHKEEKKKYNKKRYINNKEKMLLDNKLYMKTEQGKQAHKSHNAKRRNLGFFPLNEYFDGSEGHHISKNFVIYMPKELHHSIYHNIHTWKGMNAINQLAIETLKGE